MRELLKRILSLEARIPRERCRTCIGWRLEYLEVNDFEPPDPRLSEPRYTCPDCGWQPRYSRIVVHHPEPLAMVGEGG